MANIVPLERIANKIYLIRDMKVMPDRGLAELYVVETKALKQAVRRNIDRFPSDFMFEMTKTEFSNWRSQFVTFKSDKMGLRHRPMAFTEQGVAIIKTADRFSEAGRPGAHVIRFFKRLGNFPGLFGSKGPEQAYGAQDHISL